MVALRYLLTILGLGLFGSAGALAAYDIFLATQLRRLLQRSAPARPHASRVIYRTGLPGSTVREEFR